MKYKNLAIVIAITIVIGFIFFFKYKSYAVVYSDTLNTVKQSGLLIDSQLKNNATVVNDSTFLINDAVLETFEKRQEKIENLLDLQFERLQSEQSLLEIWTALITIVFLVFSFYSFFHTDELVKRASEDASKIKEKLNVSEEIKKNFTEKLKGIYLPIKEDLESGKEVLDKAKQLNDLNGKMVELEKTVEELKPLPSQLKELTRIVLESKSEDGPNEAVGFNNKTKKS